MIMSVNNYVPRMINYVISYAESLCNCYLYTDYSDWSVAEIAILISNYHHSVGKQQYIRTTLRGNFLFETEINKLVCFSLLSFSLPFDKQ